MDRTRSLRKIPTRLHGTNLCTSSPRFVPCFIRQPNSPECTQMVRKRTKTSVYGPKGWIGCVCCEKFTRDFVARTFALVRPVLHQCCKATKQSQMHPNSTKCTKTSFYGRMGGSGASVVKIPTRLRGTNFCTSSARFAPSSVRQPNSPKCTQIV